MNVKIIVYAKKDYSWNPSTCICENSKYLKSIADTSLIACDEIVSFVDIVSTKRTNTIATNLPINSDHNKVRHKIDFAYNFIIDHITINNYYYLLSYCKA